MTSSSAFPSGVPGDVNPLRPMRGPSTLSESVYEELKQAIIAGALRRGELYSVVALAEQLTVSRTPVREALLQLARDGMVRFERSRGVRILEPRAHDVREIFELRRLLEPWAAGEAARRMAGLRQRAEFLAELQRAYDGMLTAAKADDEQGFWPWDRAFHLAILNAAGNSRLRATVDGLREVMLLHDAITSTLHASNFVDVAEDHQWILQAMEEGDPEAAERTMREHIDRTARRVLAHESAAGRQSAEEEAAVSEDE